MKAQHIILSILFIWSSSTYSFGQHSNSTNSGGNKNEAIKVWGNCGMCKKTIETAAKKAGATSADWSTETKILTVSYNAKKTNGKKIQQAVAASGYDTQDLTASDEAYYKLHFCCQYDRKADIEKTADKCCDQEKCSKDGIGSCCTADKDGKVKDCCKDAVQCKEKGCCKS